MVHIHDKMHPCTVVISTRKRCSIKITLVLVLVPARLHKLFGSGTALHDAEVCILCDSEYFHHYISTNSFMWSEKTTETAIQGSYFHLSRIRNIGHTICKHIQSAKIQMVIDRLLFLLPECC